MRPISTAILHLAAIFAVTQVHAAVDSAGAVYTRKTQFRIPYRYDAAEMRRIGAREIRLYVSDDLGATWRHAQTVAPVAGRFEFAAPGDGEYWFSVRTLDAQNQLYPPGEANKAGLRVVVDTTPPELDVTVRQLKPGRVQLSWRAEDPHIDPRSLRLEYLQADGGQWQPVSVIPQAVGQTSWSIPQGGLVAVRGSISDLAANTARDEEQTQIAPAGQELPLPPVPSYDEPIAERNDDELAHADYPAAEEWPQIASGPPLNEIPGRLVSSREEIPDPISSQPVTTEEAAAERETDSAGNRLVRTDSFDISYEIGDVGPSGVGAVEFYITRDGGRKWFKLGDDLDRKSPFRVKVPGDGTYGFDVRVRSGVGLAAEPPQPDHVPPIVVIVDQTPPVVRLHPAQQGQGASLNRILIRWKAEDENPASKSISLSYSASPTGPWTLIRDWESDTGSYQWDVTGDVPAKLYVAVSARDAAGNVSRAVTPTPIIVDLKKPSAKIVGIKPPGQSERR